VTGVQRCALPILSTGRRSRSLLGSTRRNRPCRTQAGTSPHPRPPRTTHPSARDSGAAERLGAPLGLRPSAARLLPVPMPSPRGHIALVCVSSVALGAPALTFADDGPPPPPPPS